MQLGDDPQQQVHAALVRTVRRDAGLTQLGYGPVTLCPGGHCLTLPISACTRLAAVEAAVTAHPSAIYDPKKHAPQLFLLAAELTLSAGRTVIGYREQKPTRILGRSRALTLLYQDGRYTTLDPTDLLMLDLTFDVITAEGIAYFEKKRTFEKVFDHLAPIRAAAKATFQTVTSRLRIKGAAEMEKACTTDPNMMAKMASISRSTTDDPSYATSLTMPKLLSFIDAHSQYGVQTTGAGRQRQLVFDSAPAERYKILHLLDDDYLQSQLTQRSYESGSKTAT